MNMYKEILRGLKTVCAPNARQLTSYAARRSQIYKIPVEEVRRPPVERQSTQTQRDPLLLTVLTGMGTAIAWSLKEAFELKEELRNTGTQINQRLDAQGRNFEEQGKKLGEQGKELEEQEKVSLKRYLSLRRAIKELKPEPVTQQPKRWFFSQN